MIAGVGFGGPQPQTAGALLAPVFLPHLAEGVAVPAGRMFLDGNRDEPGTLHLSEEDRLSQCTAGRRRVVVGDQDSPQHFSSVPLYRPQGKATATHLSAANALLGAWRAAAVV